MSNIDEISALPAGRLLDQRVAVSVTGCTWKNSHIRVLVDRNGRETHMPDYSTSIQDAWTLIEYIRSTNPHWSPSVSWDDGDGIGPAGWACSFYYFGEFASDYKLAYALADTAPLAICRAALMAFEVL